MAERPCRDGVRCLIPYLRGYGPTRFRDDATLRSGEQAALGADLLAFLDALGIERAVLAGYDWGGRAACVVAALWPARAAGLVSGGVAYNIQNIPAAGNPAPPDVEHRLWYQYYLHGERGRAGLAANRASFCALLWRLWSPTWQFSERPTPGPPDPSRRTRISWRWWSIPTATASDWSPVTPRSSRSRPSCGPAEITVPHRSCCRRR